MRPANARVTALAAVLADGLVRALVRALVLAALVPAGCARPAPCDGMTCAAACPRDAARDASGRCACGAGGGGGGGGGEGTTVLLGACVPPALADAFCGPAAVPDGAGGCAFRSCPAGRVLDVATGACASRGLLASLAPGACANGTGAGTGAFGVLENGSAVCAPLEAACPRGSAPPGTDAPPGQPPAPDLTCARPPRCPPGSLPEGASCRPIVTSGGGSGRSHRVDVGAWAALVLGVDGGRGSLFLCQPLAAHPSALGPAVRVAVSLVVPDQDLARVEARIEGSTVTAGAKRPLTPAGQAVVEGAVRTLLEPLRALGGEAAAASVALEVTCGRP